MINEVIQLKKDIKKRIAPLVHRVGIDVEEVGRFRELDFLHDGLYQKIFTDKEKAYCMSKRDPYPHFAARFAAKEAVAKAIGVSVFKLKDIEIMNESTGRPKAVIHSQPKINVEISLSHTKDRAAAIAIWLC